MSLYTSLNIAQQALTLNQTALNVANSNIANMNNENYSKQRVEIVSSNPMKITGAYASYNVTAGAQIGSIARYREAYLDSEYRQQNSQYAYYNELATLASSIETSCNELNSGGLQDAMSEFISAAQTLNAKPEDSTARVNFVEKAKILCTQFNQVANTLTSARKSVVGSVDDAASISQSLLSTNVKEVNNLLSQLSDINEKIVKTSSSGTVSNDLLDQRDALLDSISGYMPIDTEENSNGSVNISVNGLSLIKGTKVNTLDVAMGTAAEPTHIQVYNSDGELIKSNVNSYFDAGTIGAYLTMGGDTADGFSYQSVLNQLNSLASTFATAINDIQTYNDGTNVAMGITFDASGKATLSDFSADGGLPPMFGTSDGSATITAANMKVSDAISSNYWKVATARVDTSTTWDPKSVGNANNISQMSSVYSNNYSSLGNMTPEAFLTNMVSGVGANIETIEFKQKSQTSLYNSISTERQSTVGVNLNEELIDLTKYQRAFQAASRIFTVTTEIMSDLVNLGR